MNIAANGIRHLSDGRSLDDLIKRDTREVSLAVMNDAELYEWELQQLFGRCWNLMGHESEIPEPNDYMVRPIGEDELIIARDRKGEIHASLNVCPHRGMRVALGEEGNSPVHKCIYHGWAFRPNGDFVGAPAEKEKMHGTIRDKSELGLKKARVALYGGLIFATWEHDGPSLEDYLGDFRFYLDMLWNRTDRGTEVLGPPQKVLINCNWKSAAEQAAGGDGFHTISLHRWLIDAGLFVNAEDGTPPAMYGVNVSANGHVVRCIPVDMTFARAKGAGKMSLEERLQELPPPGITPELVPQLSKHLSDDQIRLLVEKAPQVGGIFPNVNFLFVYAPQSDGTMLGAMGIHIIVPRGVDKCEFWTWMFAEKDCPEPIKEKMLRNAVQQIGSSGLIEQDDTDTWPHITRSARGAIGRRDLTLKYQATDGENKPEGWPGGGHVFEGFAKDDTQWYWWLAYRDAMLP